MNRNELKNKIQILLDDKKYDEVIILMENNKTLLLTPEYNLLNYYNDLLSNMIYNNNFKKSIELIDIIMSESRYNDEWFPYYFINTIQNFISYYFNNSKPVKDDWITNVINYFSTRIHNLSERNDFISKIDNELNLRINGK